MIDSDGTEASSDDENNRFCGIESAELQAFPCIAGQHSRTKPVPKRSRLLEKIQAFGLQLFEQFFCLKYCLYDAEWIGKVFRIEVAAQLPDEIP